MAVDLDQIRKSFTAAMEGQGGWSPLWEVKWGNDSLSIVVGGFDNPDQKYALMGAVGDMADSLGGDTVVFISDVWHKEYDQGIPQEEQLRPSEDPSSDEAVMIAELTKDEQHFTLLPYGRGDDGTIEWQGEPVNHDEKQFASPLTEATREKLVGGKLDQKRAKRTVTKVLSLGATVSLRSGLLDDLKGPVG